MTTVDVDTRASATIVESAETTASPTVRACFFCKSDASGYICTKNESVERFLPSCLSHGKLWKLWQRHTDNSGTVEGYQKFLHWYSEHTKARTRNNVIALPAGDPVKSKKELKRERREERNDTIKEAFDLAKTVVELHHPMSSVARLGKRVIELFGAEDGQLDKKYINGK